jgi:ribonuclease HI
MSSPRKAPAGHGRLFAEPHPPAPPGGVYLAYIDGAARGNPGPASYAVIVRGPDGNVVSELKKSIGRETNNVAEYFALIAALDYAAGHDIRKLRIRSDSELLVRQMQGRYKVKSPDLRPLHERASKLARALDYFAIEHVPREENLGADRLANEALDGASGPSVTEPRHSPALREPRATRGSSAATGNIRARYLNGVLVPAAPLDLPEGAEVFIDVRISKKN